MKVLKRSNFSAFLEDAVRLDKDTEEIILMEDLKERYIAENGKLLMSVLGRYEDEFIEPLNIRPVYEHIKKEIVEYPDNTTVYCMIIGSYKLMEQIYEVAKKTLPADRNDIEADLYTADDFIMRLQIAEKLLQSITFLNIEREVKKLGYESNFDEIIHEMGIISYRDLDNVELCNFYVTDVEFEEGMDIDGEYVALVPYEMDPMDLQDLSWKNE